MGQNVLADVAECLRLISATLHKNIPEHSIHLARKFFYFLACRRKFSTVFSRHSFLDHTVFCNLPSDIESFMNEKARFNIQPKLYFKAHSFYSVGEYLLSKCNSLL
jgi:hypothetical protein